MSEQPNTCLQDRSGRILDYLRVSVTNRCNLRCSYCMPTSGIKPEENSGPLTIEELTRLCTILVPRGLRKIRITGGEPLLRPDLSLLLKKIREVSPDVELCMTTNGVLLAHHLADLRRAGLDRLNVSLDTMRPERFEKISGSPYLHLVLEGIEEIISNRLFPLKVNVLLLPGINEDEIEEFIELARKKPIEVRFIEMMPLGVLRGEIIVPVARVEEVLIRSFGIYGGTRNKGDTSKTFTHQDFAGKIGLISPLSQPFCKDCNRLRITAEGNILSCLLSGSVHEVRTPLRNGCSDEDILAIFEKAVSEKPSGHNGEYVLHHNHGKRCMTAIGG